jgi:hypothetical protein
MFAYLRHGMLGLAILALTGCQQLMPDRQAEGPDRARLAAEAARAQYPSEAEATDAPAVAIVNRNEKTIRIYNLSDEGQSDVLVWVNRSYVTRVGSMPAHGSVKVEMNRLYGPQGRNLADQNVSINQVQIQSGENLYNVQGPAYD